MKAWRGVLVVAWALQSAGCGPAGTGGAATGASRSPADGRVPPEVDIALARARGGVQGFEWVAYGPEAFALAKQQGKLVLLDGAAEWCHWCHVMDATTYRDPEVGRLLRERFVAIRVDVDAHPDIAERYGEWGWPATILMDADANELGKLRGYLPKDELLAVLTRLTRGEVLADTQRPGPGDRSASSNELPWAVSQAAFQLDGYYDDQGFGWGRRQKAALGWNLAFEAKRARAGDERAKTRTRDSGRAHARLIDPVWGGVYQYSDSGRWDRPHFEKLMPDQAANLEGFAAAFQATGDPHALAAARAVAGYMLGPLSSPEGGFYGSQDADVNAHDERAPFVDGHTFYAKDDAGRRALGMPRIDKNVYAFESGLAISALLALHRAAPDGALVTRAKRAADHLIASHLEREATVKHAADQVRKVRFLADASALGLALQQLFLVSGDARYGDLAVAIAETMERELLAPSGALFGATHDPDAIGVFAERRIPFEANVLAARLYAALGDLDWHVRGIRVLSAISTPRLLEEQGRNLGGYLLAAAELGVR